MVLFQSYYDDGDMLTDHFFKHCMNISLDYLFGRFIWQQQCRDTWNTYLECFTIWRFIWWQRCSDTWNIYLEGFTILKIYSGLNSRLIPRIRCLSRMPCRICFSNFNFNLIVIYTPFYKCSHTTYNMSIWRNLQNKLIT